MYRQWRRATRQCLLSRTLSDASSFVKSYDFFRMQGAMRSTDEDTQMVEKQEEAHFRIQLCNVLAIYLCRKTRCQPPSPIPHQPRSRSPRRTVCVHVCMTSLSLYMHQYLYHLLSFLVYCAGSERFRGGLPRRSNERQGLSGRVA